MPNAAAGTRITGAWTLGLTGKTPWGGGQSSCQGPRGRCPALAVAPRYSPSAGRGGLRRFARQWGAALLASAGSRNAGHEPTLDVAPGVTRRLRQPFGFAGPTMGGFLRGMLGLGPHGPSKPQPQALGPAKSAHPWGPRHTRQPGGYHRAHPAVRHVLGGVGLPVPGRGGVLPSGAAFGRCYSGRAGAPLPGSAVRLASIVPKAPRPYGRLRAIPETRVASGQPTARAAARRHCTLVPRVIPLGPEAGRPGRLGCTGVQHDDVAGEACPRGSKPGARRVLSKGVRLPPRQGPSSQGIRNGLGGSPVCRGSCAPLRRSQVAEPDVVEAASHTKPPAIVLRGIVPDDLVAALPLQPPPGLDRPIPFESRASGLEGPSQASPARTWEGLEGVPGPPVVGHPGTSHTHEALRAVRGNEVGPQVLSSPACREGR